jgi:hypothetical protein
MQVKGPQVSATIADCRVSRAACAEIELERTDCNGAANAALTFLDAQISQEHRKYILGSQSLCNIAKGIYSRPADALLVRF